MRCADRGPRKVPSNTAMEPTGWNVSADGIRLCAGGSSPYR